MASAGRSGALPSVWLRGDPTSASATVIWVNGYFRSQAITGQQRYAWEIADRVQHLVPDLRLATPAFNTGSRLVDWLDLQLRLPVQLRKQLLLSLTARAPVLASRHVVTIHDLFALTHPEWFAPNYARAHARLMKHHLDHASAFVTVSEPVAEEIGQYLKRDASVVVAPNASSAVFRSTAMTDDVRRRTGLQPGCDGFFLTVGSLEPRKNLATLFAAYRRLDASVRRRYPLVVVGSQASIYATATSGQGEAHVLHTGRISDQELAMLYTEATAFISVSLAEGFGIPVVEAQACGCSTILSDIPAYRWVAGGEATFVDPLDEKDIADALVDATTHVLAKAPQHRFSWDESARVVAELLERLG